MNSAENQMRMRGYAPGWYIVDSLKLPGDCYIKGPYRFHETAYAVRDELANANSRKWSDWDSLWVVEVVHPVDENDGIDMSAAIEMAIDIVDSETAVVQ